MNSIHLVDMLVFNRLEVKIALMLNKRGEYANTRTLSKWFAF